MKKGVILVLTIYEGRDWHPLDRHSTVLVAQLSTHILSTDLIPLTSSPKFNTDISWHTDNQTIRSFKLNRIPIKLECYSVNAKKQRKCLGYVIVPLAPAVEGSKADPKWYKILGGSNIPHKDPPSLLLSLSLRAMTLDQQKQKSDAFLSSMKGQLLLEHANNLPNVTMKNSFTYAGSDKIKESVPYNSTNGNDNIVQKSLMGSCHQNFDFAKSSNGVCIKDNNMVDLDDADSLEEVDEIADLDHVNDEDLYNFESDEEYSDEANYSSDNDMILEGYSLAKEAKTQVSQQDDYSTPLNSCNDKGSQEQEKEITPLKENSIDETPELNKSSHLEFLKTTCQNYEQVINKRAAFKEGLHSSVKQASLLLSPELSIEKSAFAKRTLGSPENSNEQKCKKSRKVDKNSYENSANSSCIEKVKNFKSHALLDIENNPEATSTAILLSQSLIRSSSPIHDISEQHLSFGSATNSYTKKLTAHLNQDGGFFQIGCASADDVDYIFSITIIYAENLSDVVPKDMVSSEHKNFQFQYSLLDWPITTDSFTNLDHPDFISEKATAAIRCTNENLSEYFNQHSILSIQLVNKDKCLALCAIDIRSLVTIIDKKHVLLEGPFDIYGVGISTSSFKDKLNKSTAKLGVSIELSLNNSGTDKFYSINSFYKESCTPSEEITLKKTRGDNVSSCTSSDSDSELISSIHANRKSRAKSGKRFCSCCSKHYLGKQGGSYNQQQDIATYQISLMNKAKKEVKEWKIERRKCFKKELDIYAKSLQEKITNECLRKLSEIETDLNCRIEECDLLKEKLTSALNDLDVREVAIHSRETKVAKLEKELEGEKTKLLMSIDDRVNAKNGERVHQIEEKSELQDTRICQLEHQNGRLQEEYTKSESAIRVLTLENIGLKRQLLESVNFISTVKEKDILAAKVNTLQERKRYYKEQWMKALSEMHMLHTSNKKYINQISSGLLPYACPEMELEKHNSVSLTSHAGYKLKKLKEERKTLMESGQYTSDHVIIKNIDKKIKTLILGSS